MNTLTTFEMNNYIKGIYLELMYLGTYYRWASKHSPHIGERSPLGGHVLTRSNSTGADVLAYYQANKAMSKVYFAKARELRITNK